MKKMTKMGLGIVAIFLLLIGGAFYLGKIEWKAQDASGSGATGQVVSGLALPSDGDSAVTLNLYNKLNTTGDESFDADYRVFDANGEFVVSGTDTTASSVTVNSNQELVIRLIGSSSADSARIFSAEGCNAQVIEGGKAVKFKVTSATCALNLYGAEASAMQFKSYDNLGAGWMHDDDGVATAFEADGVEFESTTNGTDYTVGTAGEVDITQHMQTTGSDTLFGDFGFYVAIDAATTVWDEPSVKFEGVRLEEMKGDLNTDESRAMSGYEYVFFVPNEYVTDSTAELDFQTKALAGVNPGASDDIQIDYISVSAFKQNAGSQVKYAAYNDASSPTVIHAVQDTTITTA